MAAVPSSSHINYSNYPLQDIPQPHAHDVLCGRGGGTNNHIGNSHWRMLVAANKQLYISLPKRQKMLLSRSIVNAVRSQMPPGRFLQKDEKTSLWFDVGDQRAQEKTSQALREGAPDIRKKGANVAGSASAAAKEGGSVLQGIGSYDGEEESNQGEGYSASDDTLNDNTTGPPIVPDTSAAPISLSAENATSSSNTVDSSAPTSSLNQPQVVSASSGRFSSSENSEGGGMPPLFFPNSSTTSTDSFDNPLLQHQNFFATSGSHNHNAMMQMMYQNMYMNYGSAMFHPTATMSSLLTPQQQQQQHRHMMQMMMATTENVSEGMNPHMSSQFSTSGPAVMQATSSMLGNVPNQQHLHNNDCHSRRRSENYEDDDSSFLEPLPLNHSALAAAAAGTRGGGGPQAQGTFVPTFDEFVVQAPDTLEPAGLSYGSMSMSESEMRRLQSITASFGSNSRGSYTTNPNSNNNNNDVKYGSGIDPMPNHNNDNNDDNSNNNHYHHHPNNDNMLYPRQQLMQQPTHNQHQYNNTNKINNNSNSMVHKNKLNHHHKSHSASNHESSAVPAALDSLEPTGISFGDVSMMSAGTMMTTTGATHNNNNNFQSHHDDNHINNNNLMMMKLEDIGTSFGTMMSLGTTMRADMVDGGLVDSTIGTSFGSLSLDPTQNRESLFRSVDTTAASGSEGIYRPEAPPPNPMFDSERKAKGNLLECSDTESETSEDKQKLTQQKSQAWEKMKQATETKLKQQGSRGSVTSDDLMPPPNLLLVGVPPHLTPLSQQQLPPSSLESKMPATFENAEVAIPTTQLENNFSALSAWSAVDDFDGGVEEDVAAVAAAASYPHPPPPSQPLEKEDSW